MSENGENLQRASDKVGCMTLDHDACYRAVSSRDVRFDGRIFTGVKTTGIYCRPICPARTPKSENVVFFSTAAAAQEAGFRSCLRCRPECSPDLAIWRGTSNTVSRGLALIADGALDGEEASVEQLAARLGMGERQLRRLFQEHLGASPITVAQTRRVLFAKQLIAETDMPLAHVALASGFGSVRRFNAVFQKLYSRPPGQFRRMPSERSPADDAAGDQALVLMLPFAPPYDFAAILAALAARLDASLEQVENGSWRRRISLNGAGGSVDIGLANEGALRATIRFPDVAALPGIVRRIRRVFDLSADPIVIGKQLADDPLLAPLVRERPGLRVPGLWEDAAATDDDGRASYDAFDPESGRLRAAIARLFGQRMISPDELQRRAERWRPWRAYATAHLLAGAADPLLKRATPRARKVIRTTGRLARAG
jgi:AraC family transcriptional regulator, regulatory protein of adaptative response / DNA-3-methyladenine glycosylase II